MEKIKKSEQEWRQELTPEQYHIMREAGTERAFTGKYYKTKNPGVYACAACGQPLFDSETKYESGTGWPSFYKPVEAQAVDEHADDSYGMRRVAGWCSPC